MKTLGARGIQVFTNVAGKPLSAAEFRPIFQRMAARPAGLGASHARAEFPRLCERAGVRGRDLVSFGWPYETTACMTRLIYSGLFDELPDLKIITHHMGGMIPYFAGKIDLGFRQIFFGTPEKSDRRGRRPEASADRLLQDALCRYRAQRRYARRRAAGMRSSARRHACSRPMRRSTPEHGRGLIRNTIKAIEALPITAGRREMIFAGNARELLKLPAG